MTDDELDAAILEQCTRSRRKVALVVALTLTAMKRPHPPGLDDLAVARRVKALVQARRFKGWGDLDAMRFAEVALPD